NGWCSGCHKWHEAPVDFSKQVLGQGRIGVRLASLIAYLRTVMRLPLRQLRDVLQTLHGFEISLGELVELLHRITEYAQPVLEGLHQRCWVHFLRDVHDLKKEFPDDEALLTWAKQVKAIYERAVGWAEEGPDKHSSPSQQHQARLAQQQAFEQELWRLCQPYVR